MVLKRLHLVLKAFYRAFISPSKKVFSYSQFAEDLIISNILKSLGENKSGCFVDVGSHHPRRGSNTYLLYKKGWSGLLIDLEEDKVLAAKLARPRDKAVMAAVSSSQKKVKVWTTNSFSTNTSIAEKDHVIPHENYKWMRTKTLTEILLANNIDKNFKLLTIDVEGVDIDVLKGLDLKYYRPLIICVENWCASNGIENILESPIHNYLLKFGYNLKAWSGLSTIYCLSNFQ